MFKGSVWLNSCEIPERESLEKNIKIEVAIIGGGLAGILIADRLQKAGKKVIVLEAGRIACGQTKNTTAKITLQHGAMYADLINKFGIKKAEMYAKANLRALEWYKCCVDKRKIDCDFEVKNAYVYSKTDDEKLINEYNACKKLNLPVEYIKNPELPFKTLGAVKMREQAQFNPIKFIKAIADNITIYENTPVTAVKNNTLYCGIAEVEAEHIVFACHYPFINFPGLYFARMYQQRSYVLALKNTPNIDGMYISTENNCLSLRQYGDFLLLGGGQHRAGENHGDKYDLLQRAAKSLYPECEIAGKWSAQDCITADGIPYIGSFSDSDKNWYVATGFGKWGMTTSAVAAEIITDLILNKKNNSAEVFSPQRFTVCSAIGVADEVFHSAKGLIKQLICIPKSKLRDIPVGSGGAVLLEGKRVGVYRESEEKYYCVKLRCPHLGCRLEWNQDEKSWDCPCHGSRFDYKGYLIDNPAQTDIQYKF